MVEKEYRIIAVANTIFYGESAEDAKDNFMRQAETIDEKEWTFILVEELKR